jgi:hypothetical protein
MARRKPKAQADAWAYDAVRGSKTCGFCHGGSLRYAVPAVHCATAYKSRKTLPSAFGQMMAALPSLAMKRDRSEKK